MTHRNAKTVEDARAAKPAALKAFSGLVEVAGVGITRVGEGYGLKVNLASPPDPALELPTVIEGVPVKVEVVGIIKKL